MRTIFIIRHAEKPPDGPHLSERGYERAQALADLFGSCFARPDALFAAATSPKSARPVETLEPLAARLGLTIEAGFGTEEVDRLARHVRDAPGAGRIALISWRHDAMAPLARALGAGDPPSAWPQDVFDRVWRLLVLADGSVRFADLAQALLPGDAPS